MRAQAPSSKRDTQRASTALRRRSMAPRPPTILRMSLTMRQSRIPPTLLLRLLNPVAVAVERGVPGEAARLPELLEAPCLVATLVEPSPSRCHRSGLVVRSCVLRTLCYHRRLRALFSCACVSSYCCTIPCLRVRYMDAPSWLFSAMFPLLYNISMSRCWTSG